MSALAIAVTRLQSLQDLLDLNLAGADDIYVGEAPQNKTAPYVVANLVSEPDEEMLAGAGGYVQSRVQINCVALNMADANDMGEVLKRSFPCVKATIDFGDASPEEIAVDVDIMKTETDFTDAADDRTSFRRVTDYYIRWRLPA
jgi:hypothetical protein